MIQVVSQSDVHFGLARPFLSTWSAPEVYYVPDFSGVMKLNLPRPALSYVRSQNFTNREIDNFGS